MQINIKSSRNINAENGVNALVYGASGVGKTVLATTAPTPLIISLEGGLLSLADRDVDIVECSTLADVKNVFQFVTESEDAAKYETIVLDSISEIAETMLLEYSAGVNDLRQAYGKLNTDMIKLIRSFRDISHKNVYFVAKEGMIEDPASGITKYGCSMPGKKLVTDLPYFFDLVLALRIKEIEKDGAIEYRRYIQTQPCIQYNAKDRSGKLNAVEKPNLSEIFAKVKKVSSPK